MLKIIIVCDSLRVGGIQRALVNLLDNIDYSKYQVTLLLFNCDGQYMKELNGNVKIIAANKMLKITNTLPQKAFEKGKLLWGIRKLIALMCKILGANFVYGLMFLFERKKKGFDIAISFTNNANNNSVYFGANKYVLQKIEANKKVSWLHVDFEKMNLNNNYNIKEYEKFDNIIHVSKAVKDVFLKSNPTMESKSGIIYNFVNEGKIEILSNSYSIKKKSPFSIVSIGRLEENKSPLSYVKIATELAKKKIDFEWWILGEGIQRYIVQKEIEKNNLQNKVFLLGEIENPYPYIKAADLFVSASISESFGLAIAEAMTLKVPVVARYYPALKEILNDRDNGLIAYGDDENLVSTVLELVENKELYKEIKSNTRLLLSTKEIKIQFEKMMVKE